MVENTQSQDQKEKRILKKQRCLRDVWDNIKHTNVRIVGVPEGHGREKGVENLLEEVMTENFPNLAKEIDIQVQEAQVSQTKRSQSSPQQDTS